MEKLDILQRDLNLESAYKQGRTYMLKERCVVNNFLYQSTKDNNIDHPLMGKYWNQLNSVELECLLSSTDTLSSTNLLSSEGCGQDILPPPPEEDPEEETF